MRIMSNLQWLPKLVQATLAVLRVLQKLSDARPNTLEALKEEYNQVMAKEIFETGLLIWKWI